MPEILLANEKPRARKQHKCLECFRTIEPGEQYHRQRNIGDDGPYVWKACRQCSALSEDLFLNDFETWPDDGCWPYLPDVDWPEVAQLGEVWVVRAALYKRQWRRRGVIVEYPLLGATDA